MNRNIILFLGLIICSVNLSAQSVNIPLKQDYLHRLDRFEIKNGQFASTFYTSVKPYRRDASIYFVDSLKLDGLSRADQFNQSYLRDDSWEWISDESYKSKKPIFNAIYRTKSDFYHVATNDFDLHINPVLNLTGSFDTQDSLTPYQNTRGIELRGMIKRKLGFYSYIGENQAINPAFVRDFTDSTRVVPHEGFWKNFKENGVDYLHARGYISFDAIDAINFQFGHDRFFIGNGYRSLILSDFSPYYLFLKINTKIWKFNYTNLFTEMRADAKGSQTGSIADRYPKKYVALHHLSINITDFLNIGFFETVSFGHADSLGVNQFNLNYLNPIIFYRAVEHQAGSQDNVSLGMDFKLNFARHFSVYGQLLFDEFLLAELRSGSGWWANKYGIQLGGKYIDAFGISNLDLQVETNMVRPYTYAHFSEYSNYAHYRQPIAHPLGANFEEYLGIIRFQPMGRLFLTAKFIYAKYGLDRDGLNYGKDILKNYANRPNDYGNFIGQGAATTLQFIDFTASFMLRHNLFIDFNQLLRNQQSDVTTNDQQTTMTTIGIRLNTGRRMHDF